MNEKLCYARSCTVKRGEGCLLEVGMLATSTSTLEQLCLSTVIILIER